MSRCVIGGRKVGHKTSASCGRPFGHLLLLCGMSCCSSGASSKAIYEKLAPELSLFDILHPEDVRKLTQVLSLQDFNVKDIGDLPDKEIESKIDCKRLRSRLTIAKHYINCQNKHLERKSSCSSSVLPIPPTAPRLPVNNIMVPLNSPKCPVSGAPIDKDKHHAKVTFKGGQKMLFCSSSCGKKFTQEPGQFLVSYVTHALKELQLSNPVCPVMNRPVQKGISVVFKGGQAMMFCCNNCVTTFVQDLGKFCLTFKRPHMDVECDDKIMVLNEFKGPGSLTVVKTTTPVPPPLLPLRNWTRLGVGNQQAEPPPSLLQGWNTQRSHNLMGHGGKEGSKRPKRKHKADVCETCQKTFANKSNLNRHKRLHSGFRPFKCPHCPKSFNQKGNLNQHVRIHTGERPFKCGSCPRTFRQAAAFTKHLVHFGHIKAPSQPIPTSTNIASGDLKRQLKQRPQTGQMDPYPDQRQHQRQHGRQHHPQNRQHQSTSSTSTSKVGNSNQFRSARDS